MIYNFTHNWLCTLTEWKLIGWSDIFQSSHLQRETHTVWNVNPLCHPHHPVAFAFAKLDISNHTIPDVGLSTEDSVAQHWAILKLRCCSWSRGLVSLCYVFEFPLLLSLRTLIYIHSGGIKKGLKMLYILCGTCQVVKSVTDHQSLDKSVFDLCES